jgi:hypothetical protein
MSTRGDGFMTLTPHGSHPPPRPPNKRALTYGVTAIAAGLGTIIMAGGKARVSDGTMRLAILVFGVVATVALVGAFLLAWRNGSEDTGGDDKAG